MSEIIDGNGNFNTSSFVSAVRGRIRCPFCGSKTVEATIRTYFFFEKVRPVFYDGIDGIDNQPTGNSIEERYGEQTDAMSYVTHFECTSCGKKWGAYEDSELHFRKDKNGIYEFVKNDKADKKGKNGVKGK